jgi:hypothetical protein
LLLSQNIAGLTDCVSHLDYAEKRGTEVYERLRSRFPKSSKVLRQYAAYIREIRNDQEQAQLLEDFATMIDESSKGKRKKRDRKRSTILSKHNKVDPISDTDLDGIIFFVLFHLCFRLGAKISREKQRKKQRQGQGQRQQG